MIKRLAFLIFCCFVSNVKAQQNDSLSIKNGIEKPSILTTHHFGVFSSRINQNFRTSPVKETSAFINYTSGNNFHPFVEAYFPKDPDVRQQLSEIEWFYRPFTFVDQETTPADYMHIVVDAVIKEFRFGITFPLAENKELGITLRSLLFTKGKYPFSIFTGDDTIEWFHSNIAGGEDPFGRRYYGLNQVNYSYLDRNGNTLEINNNDFIISGLELSYFYYPKLKLNAKNVFLNFGSHLGINTSKFNPSLDVGVSVNGLKTIDLKNSYQFNFGVGFSLLRKNLIDFDDTIDLGNNAFLASLESDIEVTKFTKKGHYNSLNIVYQIQSRYNKKEEADYYKLLGLWQEINAGWHNGVSTLYKALSNWSLIYTYGHKHYTLSLFLKQDLLVNNAPDIQTGIGIAFPIGKP